MPSESSPKNYYYLKSKHCFKGTIYEFPFMSIDETNLFADFFKPILQLHPIEESGITLLPVDTLFYHLRLFILDQLNWNIEIVKLFQSSYILVDTGAIEVGYSEDFLRDVKNFLLLFEKAEPEEFIHYFFADAKLRGKSFIESLFVRLYDFEPTREQMDELFQAFVIFRDNPAYFQFLYFAKFILLTDLDEIEFYVKPFRAKQFKEDIPWLARSVFDETAIEIDEHGNEIERVVKYVKCKNCGHEDDESLGICPICTEKYDWYKAEDKKSN
ncbi:MAG: hypothetical protein H7645_08310 [Candidatus Heimdallarchaeota archaeon]|nr:hypothetical protein [Candidatus Heimdallarchaeota archaeon]MCK4770327.1 hypothetical protein [Candidatus Heimdallarchaeota archaeon]